MSTFERKRIILIVVCVSTCLMSGSSLWAEGRQAETGLFEPFAIRNQAIPALVFLPFEAATARTLPSGGFQTRLDASYSSIFTEKRDTQGRVDFDLELFEGALRLDYGITDRLQVGVQAPYRFYYGGFLDGFIKDFHDTFNLPDGGKDESEDDLCRLIWKYDDTVIANHISAHQGVGDVSLFAKVAVLLEDRWIPALSVLAHARIPTGNERKMLGAGEPAFGFGIAADKHFGNFFLNLNVFYFLLDEPDFFEDLEVNNVFAGSLMVGYQITQNFAPMLQVNAATPLFDDTGIAALDRDLVQLIVGFQYNFSAATRFQIGFAEDLVSSSSPDFTVYVALNQFF
ncbi:MAG: DUF3187 family protein [Deltaproteobacteria bacterium]|nr:DUF3187 family protein [Deltaproteobacteria bacterium]